VYWLQAPYIEISENGQTSIKTSEIIKLNLTFCKFKHEGLRNQFSEHFKILLCMNLVPSTPMHAQHDKYELLRPKDYISIKFSFIFNVFCRKSMKTEFLVAVLKLFLNLLLWGYILEILKWKLAIEILSETRYLYVFPSLRNRKKEKNCSSQKITL
jgi:hypothetical protein